MKQAGGSNSMHGVRAHSMAPQWAGNVPPIGQNNAVVVDGLECRVKSEQAPPPQRVTGAGACVEAKFVA